MWTRPASLGRLRGSARAACFRSETRATRRFTMASPIVLSSFLPAAGLCLLFAARPPAPNTRSCVPPVAPPAANAGILTIQLWPPNHKHVALDLNEILGVDG